MGKVILLSMCLVAAGCAPNKSVVIKDQSSRISDLERRVEINEHAVKAAEDAIAAEISARLTAEALLQAEIDGVQAQIDEQGVKVYKCNAATSSERIFKINGKFYAAMNRIKSGKVVVALDILPDGTYSTTDGGPACVFSILNGGTEAFNLIQFQ